MVSLSIPHHGVVHREEELKVNQEGKGKYSLELTLREEWVGQKKEKNLSIVITLYLSSAFSAIHFTFII